MRTTRRVRMLEVVHDIRMREIEPAARRVVAVALLGDGERDDGHARIGESRNERSDVVPRERSRAERTDHAQRTSLRSL